MTAIAMATNLGFTNKLVFLVRKVDRRYVRRLIVDRPRAVTREKKENSLVFLRIRYSSAFPTVRARRREEGRALTAKVSNPGFCGRPLCHYYEHIRDPKGS